MCSQCYSSIVQIGGPSARSPLLHLIATINLKTSCKLGKIKGHKTKGFIYFVKKFSLKGFTPSWIKEEKTKEKNVVTCLPKLGGLSLGFKGGSLEKKKLFFLSHVLVYLWTRWGHHGCGG